MITFNYETNFSMEEESVVSQKIVNFITNNKYQLDEINYIFCDDDYLWKLNVEFLQHDTLTDIISFDNTIGKLIAGDIFISVERVKENAKDFGVTFEEELHRVMIHGILHFMGFKDKSDIEKIEMRKLENQFISLLKD